MPQVIFGIAFAGYCSFYYGLTQVQGGNWGLLDLVIPSRWTAKVAATPRDSGGISGVTIKPEPNNEPSSEPATPATGLAGILGTDPTNITVGGVGGNVGSG